MLAYYVIYYRIFKIYFLTNSTTIEQVNYNTFTSSMTRPVSEKFICTIAMANSSTNGNKYEAII